MTTEQRNNAITAFMGGPGYLREKHFKDLMDAEFELIGLEDLRFHESWDWLIPVWSKVRFELSPVMVISAITFIDENRITDLHQLISQVCINWCNEKGIKL